VTFKDGEGEILGFELMGGFSDGPQPQGGELWVQGQSHGGPDGGTGFFGLIAAWP
jgi:hypothetical protein